MTFHPPGDEVPADVNPRHISRHGRTICGCCRDTSGLSHLPWQTEVERVDGEEVLRRLVERVPVSTWRYDTAPGSDGDGALHMGPMAQVPQWLAVQMEGWCH